MPESAVVDPFRLCPRVAYIRIQKTGSSTLGECIIPTMCAAHNQTAFSFVHMEYRRAKHKARDCMLTMLRDPVERFLSEFSFIRTAPPLDVHDVEQDQWDFDADDLPWLRELREEPDSSAALLSYLRYPRNPSRNRQALYVLGFQRVPCREDRCCGQQCTKPEFTEGFPAREYDWDGEHDRLLARAKRHLLGMRAFGVADCYVQSMDVIASAFGWDARAMRDMASAVHLRQQERWEVVANLSQSGGGGVAPVSLVESRHERGRDAEDGVGSAAWRSFFGSDVGAEIRQVNRLDVELVAFAKKHLYEKHGVRCG